MEAPSKRVPIAAAVIGAALLIYGLSLVYHPLAYVVSGVMLIAGAVRHKATA